MLFRHRNVTVVLVIAVALLLWLKTPEWLPSADRGGPPEILNSTLGVWGPPNLSF
jgi:hypothetical protein